MNRNEALQLMKIDESGYNDYRMKIHKIYDSFEEKTCSNCIRYISYHKLCRDSVMIYGESFLSKDFGCNKWRSHD